MTATTSSDRPRYLAKQLILASLPCLVLGCFLSGDYRVGTEIGAITGVSPPIHPDAGATKSSEPIGTQANSTGEPVALSSEPTTVNSDLPPTPSATEGAGPELTASSTATAAPLAPSGTDMPSASPSISVSQAPSIDPSAPSASLSATASASISASTSASNAPPNCSGTAQPAGCPGHCAVNEEQTEDGSCYWLSTTTMNWNQAVTLCGNRGTGWQLASVRSELENGYIAEFISGKDAWLGGTDSVTDGTWKWLDEPSPGQPFWKGDETGHPTGQYTNWGSEEPSGSNGEDCIRYHGATPKWSDSECDQFYMALCQKRDAL